MAVLTRGVVAVLLLRAAINGSPFPSAVPDTPANRKVWDDTRRDIANLPPGVMPDVPYDYNEPPAAPTVTKGASDPTDPNPVDAAHVVNHMLRNYPSKALGWMDGARWIGPIDVPADRVDTGDVDGWAASHQPDRVKHFAKQLKKGTPLSAGVSVQEPGESKIKVVDGHHRYLASVKAGVPFHTYIGFVDKDGGPWDETHLYQFHQGADPQNKDADPEVVKVGPKGYIHGWIFVGAPGVGDDVQHAHYGSGKVTSVDHEAKQVHVQHADGTHRTYQMATHVHDESNYRAPAKPEAHVRAEERVAAMKGALHGAPSDRETAKMVRSSHRATQKGAEARWNGMSDEQRARARAAVMASASDHLKVNLNRDSLRHLLADGRLKNIHELPAGSRGNRGESYMGHRAELERLAMGYDDATPVHEWPIYGTADSGDRADGYGDIEVHLKEGVRSRTSATVGDSLNDDTAPLPLSKLASGDFTDDELMGASNGWNLLGAGDASSGGLAGGIPWTNYMEAQIHGGVSLDDIASVRLPKGSEAEAAQLRKLGIEVTVASPPDLNAEIFARLERIRAGG